MQKAARRFKIEALALALALVLQPLVRAEEIKKHETGLYRDIFLQNIYFEATNWFHLERFYRGITGKKSPALDVNDFDEVSDSLFFTNRHAKKALSAQDLVQGYHENDGPDLTKPYTVIRGKFDGLHPGFFIRDEKGDEYLLKFDSDEGFELATTAEVIASRFLYAIGYNVPQYTIATLSGDQAQIDPKATIYDDTGFKKVLTQERFNKYLMFIPQDSEGKYRASASKMLVGENKGFMSFQGRRKEDPNDTIDHERRRSLRALRVFGSWLNIYDLRESNTLDMLVTEDGKQVLKHYLIDFNDSLGASASGPKPPSFTYEHMMDYGDMTKAYGALGLWEKTWQKKWKASGETVQNPPAVGYFDSQYVQPGKYKTQLPHYAFKDMTRADAFWAAKIIHSFSDSDIQAIVKAGHFSSAEDEALVAKILIERRDMIVKYWYSVVNPLDDFEYQGGKLSFRNLAADSGLESKDAAAYSVEIRSIHGKKSRKLTTLEVKENSIDLTSWTAESELEIVLRKSSVKNSPRVSVRIRGGKLASVRHQD